MTVANIHAMGVMQLLHCAELQPSELGLVAVHGTGTPLGDPIEVGALGQALGSAAAAKTLDGRVGSAAAGHRVALASVKSCYGHTEGAAGLTGALLAVSSLQAEVSEPLHHAAPLHTCVFRTMCLLPLHCLRRQGRCALTSTAACMSVSALAMQCIKDMLLQHQSALGADS